MFFGLHRYYDFRKQTSMGTCLWLQIKREITILCSSAKFKFCKFPFCVPLWHQLGFTYPCPAALLTPVLGRKLLKPLWYMLHAFCSDFRLLTTCANVKCREPDSVNELTSELPFTLAYFRNTSSHFIAGLCQSHTFFLIHYFDRVSFTVFALLLKRGSLL